MRYFLQKQHRDTERKKEKKQGKKAVMAAKLLFAVGMGADGNGLNELLYA